MARIYSTVHEALSCLYAFIQPMVSCRLVLLISCLFYSDTEDEKNYKAWKKSIMLVWRAAANHK